MAARGVEEVSEGQQERREEVWEMGRCAGGREVCQSRGGRKAEAPKRGTCEEERCNSVCGGILLSARGLQDGKRQQERCGRHAEGGRQRVCW